MMWHTILLAFRSLHINPVRSLLAMTSIVIGVAAVVSVVTLGAGASKTITLQVSNLGEKLLFLSPGADQGGPQSGSAVRQFSIKDALSISEQINGVIAASPTVSVHLTAVLGNKNWQTSVNGVTEDYFSVRNAKLIRGNIFTEAQYRSGRVVCILGKTVREELFGAVNPVGSTIRIGVTACKVIGELEPKGQSGFGNDQDNMILAPLRAVQGRLVGNEDITSITVAVSSGISNAQIKFGIQELLRERRNLNPKDADDFEVMDPTELISVLEDITSTLTLFLGAIAAVSLLVGGIGIMNIMLVSVTERTREIGIRLAIGALEKEVLSQFLIEAVILTTLGGIVGVVIGLFMSFGASIAMGIAFVVEPSVVVGAFVFSSLVGIVFGFLPARRAARLDPIDSLRHE